MAAEVAVLISKKTAQVRKLISLVTLTKQMGPKLKVVRTRLMILPVTAPLRINRMTQISLPALTIRHKDLLIKAQIHRHRITPLLIPTRTLTSQLRIQHHRTKPPIAMKPTQATIPQPLTTPPQMTIPPQRQRPHSTTSHSATHCTKTTRWSTEVKCARGAL